MVRNYFRRPDDLEPGQLIYLCPAADEHQQKGKTMANTRLVPVRLTVVAEEDIEAITAGSGALARREVRIRRLTHEAYAQGGVLSELDLSLVTGYTDGGVSATVMRLRKRGEILPIRGYVADMGSWPTHKAAIVRLYLEGLTTPEIASRTYHSKTLGGPLHRGLRTGAAARRQTPARGAPAAVRACPPTSSPSTWPSWMSISWADPSTGGGGCAMAERLADLAASFVVARNPEAGSTLGYLVSCRCPTATSCSKRQTPGRAPRRCTAIQPTGPTDPEIVEVGAGALVPTARRGHRLGARTPPARTAPSSCSPPHGDET